jgi:putative addiction module component (TIGR02574 family)
MVGPNRKGAIVERLDLPIEKLSLAQKLDLMEAIWDNLTKDAGTLESPDWHGPILRDRETAMESGKSGVSDWGEAKDRIRRNVSCG